MAHTIFALLLPMALKLAYLTSSSLSDATDTFRVLYTVA